MPKTTENLLNATPPPLRPTVHRMILFKILTILPHDYAFEIPFIVPCLMSVCIGAEGHRGFLPGRRKPYHESSQVKVIELIILSHVIVLILQGSNISNLQTTIQELYRRF